MYQTIRDNFNQNDFLQNLDWDNCNQRQPTSISFNFLNFLNSSNSSQNEGRVNFSKIFGWDFQLSLRFCMFCRLFRGVIQTLQPVNGLICWSWCTQITELQRVLPFQSPFWGNFVPFSGLFLRSHRKSHGLHHSLAPPLNPCDHHNCKIDHYRNQPFITLLPQGNLREWILVS